MTKSIDEIMSRELFFVHRGDNAQEVLPLLGALGVCAAAVLDEQRRPVGLLSWRDLVRVGQDDRVESRMATSPFMIGLDTEVEVAARELTSRGLHHALVIDKEGHAVGMVSALDLLRALLDLPTVHPSAYPNLDPVLETTWSDEMQLDLDGIDRVPDGPGVFVLLEGKPGDHDRIVGAEAASELRVRLLERWTKLGDGASYPAKAPQRPRVRVRIAQVTDARRRAIIVKGLRKAMEDERMTTALRSWWG